MRDLFQERMGRMVWLLCALVALMSFLSPICSACDDLVTVPSSLAHSVNKIPPPSPVDHCNGVCSCCGFHWLPAAEPQESQTSPLDVLPSTAKRRLVNRQLAPPFQPPRP